MKANISSVFNLFVFLSTSTFIMINGINLSFVVFIFLFYINFRKFGLNFLYVSNYFYWLCLILVISIFLNLFSVFNQSPDLFQNTLQVIPNYVYWAIILMMLNFYIKFELLNLEKTFKNILYGILFLILYYYFLQDFLSNKMFFKRILANNLSFILIAFTPYSCIYLKKKYGFFTALLFLFLILFLQISSERRAGTILIFMGGILTLMSDKIFINRLSQFFGFSVLFFVLFLIVSSNFFQIQLKDKSERIYNILYNTESLTIDRSALTRLAMVEKGIILFNENKIFGIGFNNFTKLDRQIIGDFDGSEYVVNKDIYERTSSHNSYINILSEGGLSFTIPFILILISVFTKFIRKYHDLTIVQKTAFISFLMMLTHLYVINSVINSVCWLNIGLVWYILSMSTKKLN